MPSDRELSKLYSDNYEFVVDLTSRSRFNLIGNGVLAKLKQLNSSGRTLLDVGSGYGSFVELALAKKLSATGVEPAKNLYLATNVRIRNKISNTTLQNFIKTNRTKFDFVSLIHVIEHVKYPQDFLKTVLSLLKSGGVLYMETPNSYGHLAMIEGNDYTFLTPPDHLNLFSKKSLQVLVHAVDKNVTSKFYTYSYPEHLVGILRTLRRNGLRYYHLNNSINGIHTPLNKPSRRIGKDSTLPFFDRVVAPILTPLLNIGNNGSFLQVFIQKKN